MRGRWIVGGLLALAACGPGGLTPKASDPTTGSDARYEVSATVLESPDHGPKLCLGAMLTSYPPQCGDIPIANWSWDRVEGETRSAGTIWGEYHVVGTFDGKTFTLTGTPGPPVREDTEPAAIKPACPEPPGGWERPDPSKTGESAFQAAVEAAGREKDFAGIWLFDPNPPTGAEAQDMTQIVLNLAFTGDVAAHTAEVRDTWGGALCVVRHEHTLAEMERIKDEVQSVVRERGLMLLMSDADEVAGYVTVEVVTFQPSDQEALDARYGGGLVRLSARFRPVS